MTTFSLHGKNGKLRLANTIGLSLVILTSMVISTSLAAAQNPDFTISANPTTLCVNPGINSRSVISVSSTGGFSGTVNLQVDIAPNTANGPTLSSTPTTVTLAAGQTVTFNLDASTTQATPTLVYTITIAGLSGTDYHSATFSLVVSNDCSVGGVIVPTSGHTSNTSSLGLAIAVSALVAVAATGLVFYARRSRNEASTLN